MDYRFPQKENSVKVRNLKVKTIINLAKILIKSRFLQFADTLQILNKVFLCQK
jgi:hypothetical protein